MAKKTPDYAKWKLVAWRFGRVFLSAFLVTLSVTVQDLQNWESLWPLVLYPAVIAGVSALFKALRETYGNEDFTKIIYKLPL